MSQHDPWRFSSRRSPVLSTKGMCSSSQPLATQIGVGILDAGGNCVDACVAMAAALNGAFTHIPVGTEFACIINSSSCTVCETRVQ